MKIRNDFVTNSSSTSFVFGNPQNASETVETVYRLARMISSDILYIVNTVRNDIKDNIYYKKIMTLNMSEVEDYHKFYSYCGSLRTCKELIDSFENCMVNSFLVFHGDVDNVADILDLIFNEDYREEYSNLLLYSTYKEYLSMTARELFIYDIEEQDEDLCKKRFECFAYPYFSNKCNDDIDYNEIEKNIENINSFKEFAKKLGNVYLSYEECSFISLFEETLDCFANYSHNLR